MINFFNKSNNYLKKVSLINQYYEKYKNLSKEDILKISQELKDLGKNLPPYGENKKQHMIRKTHEEDLIIKAFALAKVAAEKSIGLKAYDVQLYGGLVLNEGKIAEMKTGEGKTLVAIFPAFYNYLVYGTVIIITVNDYLAKRDATQMGKVFEMLGLTTGIIQHEMNPLERKTEYSKDIVYVTNKEFGFDYLKDNMAYRLDNCVLPKLNFILIDEVDSVLIDEARTPLIISNPANVNSEYYQKCTEFIKTCELGKIIDKDEGYSKFTRIVAGEGVEETGDIVVDGEYKKVSLTDAGIEKAEKFFGVENWASIDTFDLRSVLHQCLIANFIIKENKDYIVVKDGETLKIKLIDGFTGRIAEGKEYSHGLHQAVQAKHGLEIGTQSIAVAQITYPNLFKNAKKLAGMTGTALTEKDEFINMYGLEVEVIPTNKPIIRKDLEDKVFVTKEEKYEAIIKRVQEAVKYERPVLIGTPNIEENELVAKKLKNAGIECEILNAKYIEKEAEIIAKAGNKGSVTVATNMAGRGTDIMIDDYTRSVGGLLIIGVERHESRRIDNQLCGRAGRQGDPGETVFYVSLEDEIFDYFNFPPAIKKLRNSVSQTVEISFPLMSKIIDNAQAKICGNNYRIRENLMKDDNIINKQRNILYEDRNKILKDENIIKLLKNLTYTLYDENKITDSDKKSLINKLKKFEVIDTEDRDDIIKEEILRRIDKKWADYLETIENIQSDLVFASFTNGAKDDDFLMKSSEAFDIMISEIQTDIIVAINKLDEKSFVKNELQEVKITKNE